MANLFDVFKTFRPRKTILSDDFNQLQDAMKASFDKLGTEAPSGKLGVGTPFYCADPTEAQHAVTLTYYTTGFAAVTAPEIEKARQWAEQVEDTIVNGGSGDYSALHYSAKASGYADAAAASAATAVAISTAGVADVVDKAFVDALNVDADTLDGHDTAYFLSTTGTAADSTKLDGSAASAYAKLASDAVFTADLKGKKLNETYVSVANGTDIDCDTGNVFYAAPTANKTYTFSNPPASGTAYGFTLEVSASGDNTYTWPASVIWADGTAPDAPLGGELAILTFYTHSAGTVWYGALVGTNFS